MFQANHHCPCAQEHKGNWHKWLQNRSTLVTSHITNKLEWATTTKTVVKRAQLRKLKRFGMGPEILKRFYSCNIEGILVASLPGTVIARPLTTRHHIGSCVRPITSLGLSCLPSRTSTPGGVRGKPQQLLYQGIVPTTPVIYYCMASSTRVPSLGQKGFSTVFTSKP
jgi:hypothetical protein